MLAAEGRDPLTFPSTMATTWLHVTDDPAEARGTIGRVSEMLRRPVEEIADRLPIGSPALCVDLFGRYQAAGLQRLIVWPMQDEVRQLERIAAEVIPELRHTPDKQGFRSTSAP